MGRHLPGQQRVRRTDQIGGDSARTGKADLKLPWVRLRCPSPTPSISAKADCIAARRGAK
jgi:hypothetical protein